MLKENEAYLLDAFVLLLIYVNLIFFSQILKYYLICHLNYVFIQYIMLVFYNVKPL